MKRITALALLSALFVSALPAAAASSDLPAIPFVPKTRAEAERCVVEVVNQLRAEHGLPALIHSNIPREPMFRYTTKRAQIPFIEDHFERVFATTHTEEEVTAFLDDIPAVKADPTKLWVYASLRNHYYAPAGWDDACRLAADRLSLPQLDGEPHPLLTADYLLYATVVVADSYLIGYHRGEPVYSGFVTVAGWASECWGDVELPVWKEVELCKWKHDKTHTTTGFVDVPSDHVFAADVSTLADADITKGCNPPANTRFCPDDVVTRGQMAAFLVRALGLPDGKATFADTKGHVFAADIAALADAGITRGCGPNKFCPDQPVTRGQMAAFLVRALGLPAGKSAFADTKGHVFAADVAALADAGITRGCNPPANDRFCPDQPVTRGQMAAFLVRAGLAG